MQLMSKVPDSVPRRGTYHDFRVPKLANSARFRHPSATAERIFSRGAIAITALVDFHARLCDSAVKQTLRRSGYLSFQAALQRRIRDF